MVLCKYITDKEIDTYNQFEKDNNKTGYLGELAVVKALDILNINHKSTPKETKNEYNHYQAKGVDHHLPENIEIETKNWGIYDFSLDKYNDKVISRFSKNSLKILITTNNNFTSNTLKKMRKDNMFVINIDNKIYTNNFDESVEEIENKLKNIIIKMIPHIQTQNINTLFSSNNTIFNVSCNVFNFNIICFVLCVVVLNNSFTYKCCLFGGFPPPFLDKLFKFLVRVDCLCRVKYLLVFLFILIQSF